MAVDHAKELIDKLYQDDVLMNEYRVSGTFSYQEDEEEHLKTVTFTQDAHSEKEAAQEVIETYEVDYPDACWLFGQPNVTFICSVAQRDLHVSQYWTCQNTTQMDTIQKANYVTRINAIH